MRVAILLFASLFALPATAERAPLPPDGGPVVVTALQHFCFAHADDIGALDAIVPQSEPGALPVSEQEVAKLLAQSHRNEHGYVIERSNTLLWLTYANGRSCAISGMATEPDAVREAMDAALGAQEPHTFPFAGLQITTMRFGRGSRFNGAMAIFFVGRSTQRPIAFRAAFVPADEVKRIVAGYKHH
jgi:hypothetical protein